MKKILFLLLFMFAVGFKYAYCQDNLLAVDKIDNGLRPQTQEDKTIPQVLTLGKADALVEEVESADDSEQSFEKIRAYREALENKQKELEVIRLDLEKSGLLLKKKQAEKEIFEIDKVLPQIKTDAASGVDPLVPAVKEPLLDAADVKILLLVIADSLRKGRISLKGVPYSFKEGDSIAAKLTVEGIEPSGVAFRQVDGSILKLNFIN
jgi:hypothetical protein